ncbi:Uncharacterised protein [Burkholderia pseudomallei]|nr:Uncharacterised protein [Burkholderia pseudomallei]CAJ5218616.1 Uncharacterised protein [Burkholderia pseudomallei]
MFTSCNSGFACRSVVAAAFTPFQPIMMRSSAPWLRITSRMRCWKSGNFAHMSSLRYGIAVS